MSFGDYVIASENIQNSLEEHVSRNRNPINNDSASTTSLTSATATVPSQKCFCYNPSTCSHSQQAICLDDAHSHQQQLNQQQQQFSCSTSPNYDSGNFTYNSNTSDSSLQPLTEEDDEELDFDYLLDCSRSASRHKKLNSHPTAGNDIRKLRSELTRLIKSEQWYKNELKLQKRMRLELLERLYLNEHKFIKDNQKLKTECDRLQQTYKDLEQKFDEEKENFMRKLHELESRQVPDNVYSSTDSSTNSLIFELQKRTSQCKEYETINNLLRKQKAALLTDLHALMNERDAKTALLEKKTLTLETENSQITQTCIRLVEENRSLHDRILKAEELLTRARNDLQKNEIKFKKLKFDYDKNYDAGIKKPQEQGGNSAESDHVLLKNTQNGFVTIVDELNAQIYEEYNQNSQINDNFVVLDLKSQISQLEQLRKAEAEALNRTRSNLEIKSEEIETLQSVLHKQTDHIQNLQEEISEYKKLRENLDKYVNLLEANNRELELKQNEVKELKNVLKENHLQTERYYSEILQLQTNVDELSTIRDHNLLAINKKSEEVEDLRISLSTLKEEMSGVLLDRENLKKSRLELNSLLENEKALRMSEVNELRQIIQQQSEQIMQQKLTLEKYQQKCNELCNQMQFERSEFVRRSLIQKTDDEKCDENILDQNKMSGAENSITEEKQSTTNTSTPQSSNLKSHRVAINLQLVGNEDLPSHVSEFDKHIHNIEILKTLLAQKSEKMTILCEEHEKWEKLLEKLDGVEQCSLKGNNSEENVPGSSLKKNEAKYERLKRQLAEYANLLKEKDFHIAQNENEIEELKQNLTKKSKNFERLQNEFESAKKIHAKQLEEAEKSYKVLEKSLKDELNAKLIEFEIFKPLLSEHEEKLKTSQKEKHEMQQQIKILRETIEKLQQNCEKIENERIAFQETIKRMQEITRRVPEMHDTECQTDVNGENSPNNGNLDDIDDRNLKIMKKVMEKEHRKKIARYELHIRTLLMNIKSYKKNLEMLQKQYNALNEKCKRLEAEEEVEEEKQKLNELQKEDEGKEEEVQSDLREEGKQEKESKILEYKKEEEREVKAQEELWKEECQGKEKQNDLLGEKEKSEEKVQDELQEEGKKELDEGKAALQKEELVKEKKTESENFQEKKTNKVENLSEEQIHLAEEEHKTSCTKCAGGENKFEENVQKLVEIERKYEESEMLVQTLKHQLETARNQYLEIDEYKRANQHLKLKLTNFIDDYKMISKIASNYKRQNRNSNGSTYADIIKLIEKSNNLVPNFECIFSSLNDMKIDIRQFKQSNAIGGASCNSLLKRSPSLADELRAAGELSKL